MYDPKHSPGPWKPAIGPFVETTVCGVFPVPSWKPLRVDAHRVLPEEAEANALLIAAAPELLEACRVVCLIGSGDPEYALSLCRAAFAKAVGYPPCL